MKEHHSSPHPYFCSLSSKASQRSRGSLQSAHESAVNNLGYQISACERCVFPAVKWSAAWASRFPRGRVLAWRRAPVWKYVLQAGDHDIRPRLSACNRDAFESVLHLPAGHIPRFPPQTLRRRQALGPKCAHCEAVPLAA